MKKFLAFIAFIVGVFQFEASVANIPTVQEQLEKVNKGWIGRNYSDAILQYHIALNTDVALIQMHLSLVEQKIRDNKNCELTLIQKLNRDKCLSILHDYLKKGVFPKNTDFAERTPYFIDKYGTACAVGQLIISTGYEAVANKIKANDNNDYIADLNFKYPEISEWATTFGFTLDELAWIQPCYCSMGTPATTNVSCFGGSDGYFVPNPTGGSPPYTYSAWYRWSGSTWTYLPCGGCGLNAGDYKCTVIDAMGTSQDYFASITEPPVLFATETIVPAACFGCCNGSASVSVSGGTGGITIVWSPGGQTTFNISGLCTGAYNYCITDANGCTLCDSVLISFSTGINTLQSIDLNERLYPNPTAGEFTLDLNGIDKTQWLIKITDIQGRSILNETSNSTVIKLKPEAENGIYMVHITNMITNEAAVRKLIIQK